MSPVRHFFVLPTALILLASCLLQGRAIGDVPADADQSGESIDYLRQVKPILMARCSRCHNSVENEGSLRLDDAVEMKKGGASGPVLIPGKASESLLIQAVLQTSDVKMPPEGAPLSAEQIDILRRWIDQGAVAPADE
ncbi:MAG: c-type cytochrome domain-containing protein, partial [Phycisphaerae bacterium]